MRSFTPYFMTGSLLVGSFVAQAAPSPLVGEISIAHEKLVVSASKSLPTGRFLQILTRMVQTEEYFRVVPIATSESVPSPSETVLQQGLESLEKLTLSLPSGDLLQLNQTLREYLKTRLSNDALVQDQRRQVDAKTAQPLVTQMKGFVPIFFPKGDRIFSFESSSLSILEAHSGHMLAEIPLPQLAYYFVNDQNRNYEELIRFSKDQRQFVLMTKSKSTGWHEIWIVDSHSGVVMDYVNTNSTSWVEWTEEGNLFVATPFETIFWSSKSHQVVRTRHGKGAQDRVQLSRSLGAITESGLERYNSKEQGYVRLWDSMTGQQVFSRKFLGSILNATLIPNQVLRVIWSRYGKGKGGDQVVVQEFPIHRSLCQKWLCRSTTVPLKTNHYVSRDPAPRATLSPDASRVLIRNHRHEVGEVFDLETGEKISSMTELSQGHYEQIPLFSEDGTRIYAVNDLSEVTVWEVQTGQKLLTFNSRAAKVPPDRAKKKDNLEFALKSNVFLGFRTEGKILMPILFDLLTGQAIYAFKDKNYDDITRAEFSEDGNLLLLGMKGGSAEVWNIARLREERIH